MDVKPIDRARSLEDLESDRWREPPEDCTHLVAECHRLRRVPVAELTPGDLRLLVVQKIGLEYLVSEALDMLAEDPLVEADYYPGDLLVAVLEVPPEWWQANPAMFAALGGVMAGLESILETVEERLLPAFHRLSGVEEG